MKEKSYSYQKEKVKITKDLGTLDKERKFVPLKDKLGKWVQIEFLTGERKGSRIPASMEELVAL